MDQIVYKRGYVPTIKVSFGLPLVLCVVLPCVSRLESLSFVSEYSQYPSWWQRLQPTLGPSKSRYPRVIPTLVYVVPSWYRCRLHCLNDHTAVSHTRIAKEVKQIRKRPWSNIGQVVHSLVSWRRYRSTRVIPTMVFEPLWQ